MVSIIALFSQQFLQLSSLTIALIGLHLAQLSISSLYDIKGYTNFDTLARIHYTSIAL